jgi:hypothetical protein
MGFKLINLHPLLWLAQFLLGAPAQAYVQNTPTPQNIIQHAQVLLDA